MRVSSVCSPGRRPGWRRSIQSYSLRLGFALAAALSLSPYLALADDLTELSLEELLTVEVISVAKRPQPAAEASAAVFVVTQDDIRRTGATTLPELFRFVPGLEVGEIDASNTAVSARGFNWRFSNKLLVLIDGRAVYQSTLSGVFWDQQLVAVEDIERIEVVRGPGATLYGANAVNGVINIVTKHAVDTLGSLIAVGSGVTTGSEQLFGRFQARQGARLGDHGAMRLYVTGRDVPSLVGQSGEQFNDGARVLQTGFRADWEPNDRDAFTLQGDYQVLDYDVTLLSNLSLRLPTLPTRTTLEEAEGFNLIARWTRSLPTGGRLTIQSYFDHVRRTEFDLDVEVSTFDIDVSHYFPWGNRFETIWGVGYRWTDDQVTSTGSILFQDPAVQSNLYSGFVQQDAYFFEKRLRVSAGVKFEHNEFTGFEAQPSIRAIWVDDKNWSAWGALSRAVRIPSRLAMSVDADIGGSPADPANGVFFPVEISLSGDEDLETEELLAIEFGFRKTWQNHIEFDLATYFQRYENILAVPLLPAELRFESNGPGGALIPVAIEQLSQITNGEGGMIYGLEAALQIRMTENWVVKIAGDVKDIDLPVLDEGEADLGRLFQGDTQRYQVSVRSNIDLSDHVSTTVWFRRVGSLLNSGAPGYTDIDLRFGYRLTPKIEVSVLGENLVKARRQEFPSNLYPAPFGAVERKMSVAASIRF